MMASVAPQAMCATTNTGALILRNTGSIRGTMPNQSTAKTPSA
jgi:hypothetical protein